MISSLLVLGVLLATASGFAAAERIEALATRVIAGDTLAIHEHDVRLQGIDAPEMSELTPRRPPRRYARWWSSVW